MRSWGKWLLGVGVVILGLMAVDAVAPRATVPLAAAILLAVAVAHPGFSGELSRISEKFIR